MPWSIRVDTNLCSMGEPFAVVKDTEPNEPVGCHATREAAEAQLAALYAAEDDSGDENAEMKRKRKPTATYSESPAVEFVADPTYVPQSEE